MTRTEARGCAGLLVGVEKRQVAGRLARHAVLQGSKPLGQGMTSGGRFETGKVGGDDQIMQTFLASDRSRSFRRLRFAMHKLPGTTDDLYLDILRANGKAEATFRVPAKEITTSKGDLESEKNNPWRWAEVDFKDPVHLPRHDTLGIRFQSRRGGYHIMTMQNGARSTLAIHANKLGSPGYACHSSDGGWSPTKG